MNTTEHLLTIGSEECDEIGQRICKVLRFGPDEVEPGHDLDNKARVVQEFHDLVAVLEMLGYIEFHEDVPAAIKVDNEMLRLKRIKVRKFLDHSREQGTLS